MTGKKRLSNDEFLACVRDYLPLEAAVREIDAAGTTSGDVWRQGLRENTFYLFDADATTAVCHAIEDLALEEAHGRVVAVFPDFKDFEVHRERYAQLACTIDHVEVFSGGAVPRRIRRLKFRRDSRALCPGFRVTLFEGRRRQALFIGRGHGAGRASEEASFQGFYTFSPRVIGKIHRDVRDAMAGRGAGLREFERQRAIDQAARQLKHELSRQTAALDQAVRRLQLDGERYRARNFASDLEKGLSRLSEWKTRMPQILARVEAE